MPYTKLGSIDQIAEVIGRHLKEEDISVVLFGDSPIEEETRPDIDMIDDNNQIGRALGDFRRTIEAIPIENNWNTEFRKININEGLNNEYLLNYFIDGSIRTKYLGELITSNGSGGALMLASIGAIAVKIDYGSNKVLPVITKSKLYVYMISNLSDTTKERIKNELGKLDPPVNVEFLTQEETQENIRGTAGGKARNEMHNTEIEVAKVARSINPDLGWIVIDGALRKKEFIELDRAIGVAKSFGQKVIFKEGGTKTISYLAGMKKGERSKVYRYKILSSNNESDEKDTLERIAFWYLRIREPPPEMIPLGGIVKVDLSLKENNEFNNITEIADNLSESILKIADPSIFPRPRWPSFLYPIRVAEEYLEPILYSREEFLRLGISLKRVMYNV